MARSLEDRLKKISSGPQKTAAPPPPARKAERQAERKPAYKFAEIMLPTGVNHAATVLDINDRGAKLRLECLDRLPAEITIRIKDIGLEKRADVVWQDDRDFGLKF